MPNAASNSPPVSKMRYWIDRAVRVAVAVALLPAVAGSARALAYGAALVTLPQSGRSSAFMPFFLGIVAFCILYVAGVRPTRLYVFGHELTHAIFGFLDGAEVGKISVRKDSGSVMLSRMNTLTLLAPYFFPFYTVCLILLIGVVSIFLPLEKARIPIFAALGVSWGFHLCFTLASLLVRQSDVTRCGTLFGLVWILLSNLWVLGTALVVAGPLPAGEYLHMLVDETADAYRWVFAAVAHAPWARSLNAVPD